MKSGSKKYTRAQATAHILRDVAIILLSVVFAIAIGRSGVVHSIVSAVPAGSIVAVVIAGIFFTSMFTIAPAAIVLAELGQSMGVWEVALFGALGAVVGDLLIFMFMREDVATDLEIVMKGKYFRKISRWSHFGFMRWLFPLLGAIVIASPLPDELGLAMMGLSRMKTIYVIPIVFMMNVIGIIGIVSFGQAI